MGYSSHAVLAFKSFVCYLSLFFVCVTQWLVWDLGSGLLVQCKVFHKLIGANSIHAELEDNPGNS